MKKINTILLTKQKTIYRLSFVLVLFFVISYSFLLFFNVQYTYAIKDSESKIALQQSHSLDLESKYLARITDLEKNTNKENYHSIKNIIYLDSSTRSVAFAR